ncbi:hypothetical protein B9057_05955 [Aestuarium zhoushanense]|nr:hypothetical protein B9057_05955 [Aestuarium zhoushanense]
MTDTKLPEGWIELPIEKLARITTGSRDTKDREANGEYPFFVRSQTIERINSVGFDGEGVLTAGDGVGTGKIFHYINGKCDFHQRVYLMHAFSPEITGRYFYYYFSSFFYDRIMSMTAKSSVDSVRREMIADMMVRLPMDSKEQDRIVEALSDADALIEGLERLIAKKRLIKQGAMQDLLTAKRRLPGFSGEWGTERVGDSASLITKGTTPTSIGHAFTESGVRFVKVESLLENGRIDQSRTASVSELTHRVLRRSQLREGDILVSIAGAIGRVGIVSQSDLPANTNQALAIIRVNDGERVDQSFLKFALSSEAVQNHWAEISVQGAQPNISLIDVRSLEFQCPSLLEQKAIASVLTDMDTEIQTLDTRLEKARQVKEGMMQNLLTGRIRLV